MSKPEELTQLIEYIETLVSALKKRSSNPKSPPYSDQFQIQNAREILKEISDETVELKLAENLGQVIIDVMKRLSQAHWILTAFSAVAYVLERMNKDASNIYECFQLLDKIIELAVILRDLNEKGMCNRRENFFDKAVVTVIQSAITCFVYIGQKRIFRLFKAKDMENILSNTRRNLDELTNILSLRILVDNIPCRRPQKQMILQTSNPVGFRSQANDVRQLLNLNGSGQKRVVIIYGFDGRGRTTLAEYVVSKLTLNGLKLCVVRIEKENSDLKKLQQQILFDVGGQIRVLRDSVEGKEALKEVLSREESFIFFDNVDKKLIEGLLPEDLHFRSRSRILITSRSSDVSQVFGRDKCEIYSVNYLSDEGATELLRSIVMPKKKMYSHFQNEEYWIGKIAKACSGLPRLLKAYGDHLKDSRTESSYAEALESLQKGEGGPIKDEKLMEELIYADDIMKDEDYRDAFLDICTFCYNWEQENVSSIVGKNQLKALQNRGLLTINDENKVTVVDAIRRMGASEAKSTRLLTLHDLKDTLKKDREELKGIKGIMIDVDESEITIKSTDLEAMCDSLRVLSLVGDGIRLDGRCENKFKKLRYLELGTGFVDRQFPFGNVPHTTLEMLTCLDDQSMVCTNWPKLPQNLRQLRLTALLPDDEHNYRHLWWENMKEMTYLRKVKFQNMKLEKFPEKFVLPRSLVVLDLFECKKLRVLPQGIGDLTALEKLSLKRCESLTELPIELKRLYSLTYVVLKGCKSLTALPSGFGQLKRLKGLCASNCDKLKRLSSDFNHMATLMYLWLDGCPKLEANSFQNIMQVKKLKFVDICDSEPLISEWTQMQRSKYYPGNSMEVRTRTSERLSSQINAEILLWH